MVCGWTTIWVVAPQTSVICTLTAICTGTMQTVAPLSALRAAATSIPLPQGKPFTALNPPPRPS
jgi:hypothetical protein